MLKPKSRITHQDDGSYIKNVDIPHERIATPNVDIAQAQRFLEIIGGPDALFHFQCYGKRKWATETPTTLSDIEKTLIDYNRKGGMVSVRINEFNGRPGKRSKNDVTRIRAVFVDVDDRPEQHPFNNGIKPHVIVQTGPRGWHGYWIVDDCSLELFPKVQKALARKFSPGKVDLSAASKNFAMRLPGFIKQKPEQEPFFVKILEDNSGPALSVQFLIDELDLILEDDKPLDEISPYPFSLDEILKLLEANEIGDACLYKSVAGDKYCYDYSNDEWFCWNGNYWEPDYLEGRIHLTRNVVDIYEWAVKQISDKRARADRDNDDTQIKILRHQERSLKQRIFALQSRARISSVLRLAAPTGEGTIGLGVKGDQWDKKPYLLPTMNGIVDLKTGEFYDGHQSDYITLVAPHEWKGINEPCPTWEAFLEQIIVDKNLKPDPEGVRFLQQFIGMSITGDVKENIFGVFWGEGRNGKSVLLETLKHTLGPLALKFNSEMLLSASKSRDKEAPTPGLAELKGKRLCWASEIDEGRRLDVSLVKGLTGKDSITARKLNKPPFTFEPTHCLILCTNYLPKIPIGPRDPVWDRLRLLPFRLRFTDNPKEPHERKKDPNLMDRLKAEASGILAWAVKGALEWQDVGALKPPDSVSDATQEYRSNEDIIGQFVSDCCIEGPTKEVQAQKLYHTYQKWCEDVGIKVLSKTRFGTNMGTRPQYTKQIKNGKLTYYLGLDVADIYK